MRCRVLCQVQAVPPIMPSVSLPCLQDPALVFTACQNRALLRKDTTPLSPARFPPTPHPVFGKSTYTFHPQQTQVGALILHHPLLFSSQPPFWSLRVWGNWNRNPVLNRAPDLWEQPPALCVHQLSRKMRPTGISFNQRHPPSLGNGRPSGDPIPPLTQHAIHLSGTSGGQFSPPSCPLQEIGKVPVNCEDGLG